MYGGSGRGALTRGLVRMSGGDTDAFFSLLAMNRREPFRQSPLLAAAWAATEAFERIVLSDWLVRTCRISRGDCYDNGQVDCNPMNPPSS